jgi:hypothetical protein
LVESAKNKSNYSGDQATEVKVKQSGTMGQYFLFNDPQTVRENDTAHCYEYKQKKQQKRVYGVGEPYTNIWPCFYQKTKGERSDAKNKAERVEQLAQNLSHRRFLSCFFVTTPCRLE